MYIYLCDLMLSRPHFSCCKYIAPCMSARREHCENLRSGTSFCTDILNHSGCPDQIWDNDHCRALFVVAWFSMNFPSSSCLFVVNWEFICRKACPISSNLNVFVQASLAQFVSFICGSNHEVESFQDFTHCLCVRIMTAYLFWDNMGPFSCFKI